MKTIKISAGSPTSIHDASCNMSTRIISYKLIILSSSTKLIEAKLHETINVRYKNTIPLNEKVNKNLYHRETKMIETKSSESYIRDNTKWTKESDSISP
jgi:hypothetical protein